MYIYITYIYIIYNYMMRDVKSSRRLVETSEEALRSSSSPLPWRSLVRPTPKRLSAGALRLLLSPRGDTEKIVPKNTYGMTKACGELLVNDYTRRISMILDVNWMLIELNYPIILYHDIILLFRLLSADPVVNGGWRLSMLSL